MTLPITHPFVPWVTQGCVTCGQPESAHERSERSAAPDWPTECRHGFPIKAGVSCSECEAANLAASEPASAEPAPEPKGEPFRLGTIAKPTLKHEPDRVLVTEAGLFRWLAWAMDMIDSYESRLIQMGDPEELVHSPTHLRLKREIRLALGPQCGPCRDGNIPEAGPNGYMWHCYSDGAEPCLAGPSDVKPEPAQPPEPARAKADRLGELARQASEGPFMEWVPRGMRPLLRDVIRAALEEVVRKTADEARAIWRVHGEDMSAAEILALWGLEEKPCAI